MNQEDLQRLYANVLGVNYIIWQSGEVAFEEHQSKEAICRLFDHLNRELNLGVSVNRLPYPEDPKLTTSFRIEGVVTVDGILRSPNPCQPRTVVFNAEYDALPVIGHACGHNLIASASIWAFIHCWLRLRSSGVPGTVVLLGTPAEEGGGGKIRLIDQGAYNNVAACLMAHPGPRIETHPDLLAVPFTWSLVSQRLRAVFHGKGAHAGRPDLGRNAQTAAVLAYRHVLDYLGDLDDTIINGAFKTVVPSVSRIPERFEVEYSVRTITEDNLRTVRNRVVECFQRGAREARCTVRDALCHDPACEEGGCDMSHFGVRRAYADLLSNAVLCQHFTTEMSNLTEPVENNIQPLRDNLGFATDQGNVSRMCPAIQAAFFLDTAVFNHQSEFRDAAGTVDAFNRAIRCGKGLAAVGYLVLTDDDIADEVWNEFSRQVAPAIQLQTPPASPRIEQACLPSESRPRFSRGCPGAPADDEEEDFLEREALRERQGWN